MLTLISAGLYAQTPVVSSDSTQTNLTPDCLPGIKPLYIVNNKIIRCDSVRFIQPDAINEVQILKGASATDLYGKSGEPGAVIITTKEFAALQKQKQDSVVKEKP